MYLDEIDIPSAKERFMGNEGLYKKFLFQLPEKCMMDELEKFVNDNDAAEGFKSAHTMKGVVGNLSLNKLMGVLNNVVETLRAGMVPDSESMSGLRLAYDSAMDAISEVRDNNIDLF